MSKIILDDLANLQNQQTAVATINSNNAILETAIDNTLSRNGQAPNQMGAEIDMNSQRVLNLPAPLSAAEPVRLQDLSTFAGGGTINALPAGGTTNQVLKKNSNTNYDVGWASSIGSVTSVGLSLPAEVTVTNSPVTTSGTLTGTWASQTANKVFAAPSGGPGTPAFRVLATSDIPTLSLTGDVGGTTAATVIGANKVTNAMHATQSDSTIKSNISGSLGVPSDNTITAVLDKQLGTTRGSLAYRNATAWTPLTPGTAGQVLQSGGAGADPSWLTASGTGTVTQVNTGGMITGGPITTTGTLGIDATIAPCGRITFLTGNPVMATTTSAATSVFYTPYNGNLVPIYNGSIFTPTVFAELSQTAADTTKSPAAVANNSVYDMFVWNDAGTIRCTRGPAWTSDVARSAGTALVRVNGMLLNSVSITNGPAASRGTYVGTVRSNGTATFDFIYGTAASGGGAAFFGLWNNYNRMKFGTDVTDSGSGYTYTTGTVRQARASAGNQVTLVNGSTTDAVEAFYMTRCTNVAASGANCATGIAQDSTTVFGGQYGFLYSLTANTLIGTITVAKQFNMAAGVHVFAALEQGDGSNANTFNSAATGTLSVVAHL